MEPAITEDHEAKVRRVRAPIDLEVPYHIRVTYIQVGLVQQLASLREYKHVRHARLVVEPRDRTYIIIRVDKAGQGIPCLQVANVPHQVLRHFVKHAYAIRRDPLITDVDVCTRHCDIDRRKLELFLDLG